MKFSSVVVGFFPRCTLYSIFLLNYLDLCNFHRLMIPNIYTHVAEIICYIRYYFVFFSVCFFYNCVIYKWFFLLHFKWMHYDINDRVTYQIWYYKYSVIHFGFWWIFDQKRAYSTYTKNESSKMGFAKRLMLFVDFLVQINQRWIIDWSLLSPFVSRDIIMENHKQTHAHARTPRDTDR